MMSTTCVVLLLQLVSHASASLMTTPDHLSCTIPPSRVPAVGRAACVLFLRGGADELDDEEDLDDPEDALDATADAASGDTLENPFLGMPGAGSAGAGGGLGMQDLASTLQNPQMLQDALKELQDPAVQQQVKAMMEDPAFQESMKAYMEQITKDPQFEALKKQTEQMMQEEGFMESVQKAFADMGGAAAALGAAGNGEGDKD